MAKTKRPLREKPVPAVGPLPVFRLLWAVQRTRGRIACRSLLVLLMLSGVPVVSTGATDIFNPTLDSRNTSSVTPDDTWNMTFLPAQDPFTPLLADPRQPTTAINALAQKEDSVHGQTSQPVLKVTRSILASLSLTTVESAIRVTKKWEAQGLLDLRSPGWIRVLNRKALEDISGKG